MKTLDNYITEKLKINKEEANKREYPLNVIYETIRSLWRLKDEIYTKTKIIKDSIDIDELPSKNKNSSFDRYNIRFYKEEDLLWFIAMVTDRIMVLNKGNIKDIDIDEISYAFENWEDIKPYIDYNKIPDILTKYIEHNKK